MDGAGLKRYVELRGLEQLWITAWGLVGKGLKTGHNRVLVTLP